MPLNFLGKKLYPNFTRWEQKRKVRTILWIIFAAVCFAMVVGGLIYLANLKR